MGIHRAPPPPPSSGPIAPHLLEVDQLSMKVLFEYAGEVRASDLLVTAKSPPIVRIDGELYPAMENQLTAGQTRKLIWSLLNETQQEMFERQKELDFSLGVTGDLRFRANIYYQRGSVAAAFRLIPHVIPDMDSLGLPPALKTLTLRPNGLILITGPTGSGKSTTQAAMIDLVNQTRRCHIVTVEDPIEFLHENKVAVIDQRELYSDTLKFAHALKYVLRQDPDVILVGEMRDVETIAAALTAAETGHLVIATLHTNDAVQAIDRIIDVFPPHQHDQIRVQLAFALQAPGPPHMAWESIARRAHEPRGSPSGRLTAWKRAESLRSDDRFLTRAARIGPYAVALHRAATQAVVRYVV
jgi:twitching motility protein PilT